MPGGSICSSSEEYFRSLTARCMHLDHQAVDRYADLIFDAWKQDRQVFLFGNGGSAYTASHHVTDYVKTASVAGQRNLRAQSLADNTGLITAIGNDISYDEIFRYQLQAQARPGDVAVGISCSGNSPNVVSAANWALEHDLKLVAITGFTGGELGRIAPLHIHVNSDNYGLVEDIQMAVGHVVTQSLHAKISAHA